MNMIKESSIRTTDKALAAAEAALSKKGMNLSVIDLENRSSYADALVITSATSERQARAIADEIEHQLKDTHALRPIAREGMGGWVVLDYGDLVVHVFTEELRAFYDLDGLWGDAPRIKVPNAANAAATAAPAERALETVRKFAQPVRFMRRGAMPS